MPANFEVVPIEMFPKMESLVRLCFNPSKGFAWLELRNTPYLVNRGPAGGEVYRVLVGAVDQGGAWQAIGPGDATTGRFQPIYIDQSKVFAFQKAIVDSWNNFSSQTAREFSKGWSSQTGLKSLTSANFVVKALKTGFEAIGQYESFGRKLTAWTIDDLLKFAQPYARPGAKPPGLAGFDAVLPNHAYDGPHYPREKNLASNNDTMAIPLIPSLRARRLLKLPHPGNFSYAQELQNLPAQFRRCVSFGFRGDTRDPVQIQQAGFTPNYTRPSHIQKAAQAQGVAEKDVRQAKPMDLPRFLMNQDLGEFISTSKSVAVTRMFATSTWSGSNQIKYSTDGWVYACFVEGAIEIPPGGRTYLGQDGTTKYQVPYNEQELAMPGMLDWRDVVACRKVLKDGGFTGPVYINPALQDQDSTAAPVIYDLLSGQSQGALP
jgi:hypothetical protein